ncbi:C9orf64 family protein [Megaselia abdita]
MQWNRICVEALKNLVRKMPVLNPRESGEFIVQNASSIIVHNEGIEVLAKEIFISIKSGKLRSENFSQNNEGLHPDSKDPKAIEWIFLLDTLNFCFWTPGKTDTKWKIDGHTGYFGLCAAITRAMRNGLDITNSEVYSKMTEDEIQAILKSDDGVTKCPLIKERFECLQQVGKKLISKYDGKFENCVKSSSNSAVKLLELIVTEFPCFADEAEFKGKRVSLYKRAQILIGDLWACFQGKDLGFFEDIDKITMFPDYRVPQVLVHFKSLEYSDELMKVLKNDTILENGEPMEVEIRGASIYIVEQVKKQIYELLEKDNLPRSKVNSILIDHFLWDYRREHAKELEYIPFHKTFSVYY